MIQHAKRKIRSRARNRIANTLREMLRRENTENGYELVTSRMLVKILYRFVDFSSDTRSLREHSSWQVIKRGFAVFGLSDESFFDAKTAEKNDTPSLLWHQAMNPTEALLETPGCVPVAFRRCRRLPASFASRRSGFQPGEEELHCLPHESGCVSCLRGLESYFCPRLNLAVMLTDI